MYSRAFGPPEVPAELRPVFRTLRRGTVAVDCGANVGNVTALLAERGAEVYAFEPNPAAFHVLERRFAGRPAVHCLQKAVAAMAGTSRLYLHVDANDDPVGWSAGSSLLQEKPNVDPGTCIEVETVDLDAFLAGLGRPVAVLKLDVEGAEIEILERLLDTGRLGDVWNVLVEMHDRKVPGLAERGAALRRRLDDERYAHVRLDWV